MGGCGRRKILREQTKTVERGWEGTVLKTSAVTQSLDSSKTANMLSGPSSPIRERTAPFEEGACLKWPCHMATQKAQKRRRIDAL